MKLQFFAVSVFTSIIFSVQAATVNLNVGDVITLQPGTLTTVTCGGASETYCQLPIKNLTVKLDLCKSQLNSVEDCLIEFWPAFKKSHSNCIEEAYSFCVSYCKTSPLNLDCLDLCK